MRILVLWPPSIPTYFNAGHHLALWETAAYMRRLPGVARVDVLDGGALNLTWERVARELVKGYDLIAIQNEFDTAPAFRMLVGYSRELSPDTPIVTFGRASHQVPGFFHRYDCDAIVVSGDFEAGMAQYLEYRKGSLPLGDAHGLRIRVDKEFRDTGPGLFLPPDQWQFPPVSEVPWDSYNAMYADHTLKFSGLAHQRELPVPISRGCPLRCGFCLVSRYQGRRERRRTVEAVMEYIRRARREYAFDYLSTYSPTFTLDRDWVMAFCREIAQCPGELRWKTCTTLHHLDQEMVDAMADSRCVRISVGLESLDPNTHAFLPGPKQADEDRLRCVAQWCRTRGVELNCLVMLGMPGQTPAGLQHTLDVVREAGARVRPMTYTDFSALRDDMDEYEMAAHCRQLSLKAEGKGVDRQWLYRLRFGAAAQESTCPINSPN